MPFDRYGYYYVKPPPPKMPKPMTEPGFQLKQLFNRFGVVVCGFSDRYQNIANLVYSRGAEKIYVVPRYLFTKHYLDAYEKEVGEQYSKSMKGRLQKQLSVGDEIDFTVDEGDSFVVRWQMWSSKLHRCYEIGGAKEADYGVEFFGMGVISNHRVRQFFCQFANIENVKIPGGILDNLVPNVAYRCAVELSVNPGIWSPADQLAEHCHPQHSLKLVRFTNVMHQDKWAERRFVKLAPWNALVEFDDLAERYATPFMPYTERFSCVCFVLNHKEVHLLHRPNVKVLIGKIVKGDCFFFPGTFTCCTLYYCRYNNAFVLLDYYPLPEPNPKSMAEAAARRMRPDGGIPLHVSKENPMPTRWDGNDQVREFMGYVKLNKYGHYYCTFAFQMVDDPNNVLHGRVQLGKENDLWKREKQHELGTRVWLRYKPEKRNYKWEIARIFEEDDKGVEHKPFTSTGFRLNHRGWVYCPHVCNFPTVLVSDEDKAAVTVGEWFKFEAQFNEATRRYVISKIVKKKENRGKVEMLKHPTGKDVYAYKIWCRQNFIFGKNILFGFHYGFVEDIDTRVTMFICSWAHAHNDLYMRVPVWCRYNPNVAARKAPLCVIGIEEPPGTKVE